MSKATEIQAQITAQNEFVEGYLNEKDVRVYPTIAEVGRRNGISRTTVYRLAKEQEWQSKRDKLLAEVATKHQEKRVETLADERALFDKRCTQLVEAALSQVAAAFTEAQEKRVESKGKYKMPEQQLESLMRSLSNAQKIGKLALGEAQEIQKVAADVTVSEAFDELVREVEELGRRKASFGNHSIN